ncbi:hypothetical protein [Salinimonas lutimaris]|uniref:hypothetical protein n=1 Tax=Salinimonas lutimaris TaxID=914153 RepID=UPI0010BFE843|nr:hypothetical protein [Salinimonas lutimaris]
MKANFCYTALLTACFSMVVSLSALAQVPAISPDMNLVCHALGETVAEIQTDRRDGVADEDSEGMQFITALSGETDADLLTQVELFLDKTERLPAHWTEALYTHACLYNYTARLSQVALMSSMVKARCNMAEADSACLQKIFSGLPYDQAI